MVIPHIIIILNILINIQNYLFASTMSMSTGSLYDLWNQNYIVVGNKENVKYFTRVALGAYANPML
jgi:hypothetical protein